MSEQLPPERVAAVDLGSNSFHMKVAHVVDGQLRVVDRMREMVRLAAGLDENDYLTEDTMGRAIDCLHRFGQGLRDVPPENVRVRVVGTNTLRRARNSGEFLTQAEKALGHTIEIIAGREEARLIYLGVAHSAEQDKQQRLVIDIGGGSTEVIIGKQFEPLRLESLYIGCVGLSGRFFHDGRIRRKHFRAAQLAAERELEPIQQHYREVGWEAAIGASGTIRTVESIVRDQQWSDHGITADALEKLKETLIEAGDVERLSILNEQSPRAAVFPGGVAILVATFKALGIKRMTTSDNALREGVLYDLLGRHGDEDVREVTIRNLSSRYRIDPEQAARVEKTALYLQGQVEKSWRLGKEKYGNLLGWAARLHEIGLELMRGASSRICKEKEVRKFPNLLGWAARLHEIGLDIAHAQYHKHGAYVLAHADLPGFSRQEQELLGVLVRSHRRKFPQEVFATLSGKHRGRARNLSILLRLAVLLHRSRTRRGLPGFVISADDNGLKLAFPPGWLADHPLTSSELEEEAGYLKGAGVRLTIA